MATSWVRTTNDSWEPPCKPVPPYLDVNHLEYGYQTVTEIWVFDGNRIKCKPSFVATTKLYENTASDVWHDHTEKDLLYRLCWAKHWAPQLISYITQVQATKEPNIGSAGTSDRNT